MKSGRRGAGPGGSARSGFLRARRRRVHVVAVALLAVALLIPEGLGAAAPAGALPITGAGPWAPDLVSASAAGVPGSGASADHPEISDDGRFVVYLGDDTDVTGTLQPGPHLYLKDRTLGTVRRVDLGPGGEDLDGIHGYDLSGNGRFVAFAATTSPDLFAPEATGNNIFRFDRLANSVTWVSRTAPGLVRKADGGNTFFPRISDDGSAIVFRSNDPALDPAVPASLDPAAAQLFVWHASTGEATWVSRPADGVTITNVNDDQDAFTISGDGSTVVFTSGGSNLVAGFDPPARPGGIAEVYAVTVDQPTVGPVSLLSAVDPGGLVANVSAPVRLAGRDAVSDNGTKVIFATTAPLSQFDPAITDADVASDLLLLDRVAGTLTFVNRPGLAQVTCLAVHVDPVGSPTAAMNDDGSVVAFSSSCRRIPDATGQDIHDNTDLYRMVPGALPVLITRKPDGNAIEENGNGEDPAVIPIAMNGSGSVVAFNAKGYQADGDTSSNPDTYALTDTSSRPFDSRVNLDSFNSPVPGGRGEQPQSSDDGRFVVFLESGDFPSLGTGRSGTFAYLKDTLTGQLTKLPDGPTGGGTIVDHTAVDISGDGRFVVYAGTTGTFERPVWRYDRTTAQVVVVANPGSESDLSGIVDLSVSDHGERIAFVFPNFKFGQFVAVVEQDPLDNNAYLPVGQFGDGATGASLSGDGRTLVWTDTVPQVPGMTVQPRHADRLSLEAREVYGVRLPALATPPGGASPQSASSADSPARSVAAPTDFPVGEKFLVSSPAGPGGLTTVVDSGGNFTEGSKHALSDDGTAVVFTTRSDAGELSGGSVVDRQGVNGPDVMLGDLTLRRLTVASTYGPAFGSADPAALPETCPVGSSGETPTISDDGRVAVFGADCEPTNPSAVFVPVVPGVGRSVDGATVEPVAVGDLVDPNPQGRAKVAVDGSGARVYAQMDDVLTILDNNDDLDIYTGSRVVGPPGGPLAVDDVADTYVDVPVTVDVLANDVGGSAVVAATLAVTGTVDATAAVVVVGAGRQLRITPSPGVTGAVEATYSVADGDGNTATAVARVTVHPVGPTGLTLALRGVTPPPALPFATDSQNVVAVDASNQTGASVFGAQITVAAESPAEFSGSPLDGAADPRWTCTAKVFVPATAEVRATCVFNGTVAVGASAPPLLLRIRVKQSVLSPCVLADPLGPACVFFRAWNGGLGPADESAAVPPSIRAGFGVRAGLLRVSVSDDGPFTTGQPATYRVVAQSDAALPPIAFPSLSFAPGDPAMVFSSFSSADGGWECSANPDATVLCNYDVSNAPAVLPELVLVYTAGPGLTSGCVGVSPPCARLDVSWVEKFFPAPAVLLDRHFTAIDTGIAPHPDLAVTLSHGGVVPEGASFTLEAKAANVGNGPTTAPTTATISLPVGLTPTAAAGTGWACVLDAPVRTATCTRTDAIGIGATASSVVVTVAVAPGAVNGSASASVATLADPNPANNTATDALSIERADGSVDGALGLRITGPDLIRPGEVVALEARIDNIGTTSVAGPQSLSMSLPDGLPAGQRVAVSTAGAGWTCSQGSARGTRVLRCAVGDALAGGASSAPLTLTITGTELVAPATLDLPFTVTSRARPGFRTSKRLAVVAALRPVLQVDVDVPAVITAGRSGVVPLRVANSGTGQVTAPIDVDIPAPEGLTVATATGSGWTCSALPALRCTSRAALRPGNQTSPLSVTYTAPISAPTSVVRATFAAKSADRLGEVTATGAALLPVQAAGGATLDLGRDPSLDRTDAAGRVSEPLVVRNTGQRLLSGTLSVVELLPAGTTATGSGSGWSCVASVDRLTCERPGTLLTAGATAAPLTIALDFAASAEGTVATVVGLARLGIGGGASAAGFAVPAPPPPAPKLDVGLIVTGNPLLRGGEAAARLDLSNRGNADLPAGTVVGLVLPAGSTGMTPTGPGFTCAATTSAARAAAACRFTSALAPAAVASLSVRFVMADNAPDLVEVRAGLVRVPRDTADTLAAAMGSLEGQGAGALTDAVVVARSVKGLLADAGTDQEVFDLTTPSGQPPAATRVTLDGSGSHGLPKTQLSYEWAQASGPTVTLTGAGTSKPSFDAPRVRGTDKIDLTFIVTVSDGATKRRDTTKVTVAPAPDRPPVLTPISADAGVGSTPTAGARIKLATSATDADLDPLSFSWRIAASDGNAAGATLRQRGRTATLAWPQGAGYVTIEVTADDGRHGIDTEVITLGVPLPPVTIVATGPLGEQAAGTPATINAVVTGADPAQIVWVWQQVSGPAVDPTLLAAARGPSFTFPAPAAAAPGDAVALKVTGTRGSGASASADDALVTVRLAATPGPSVSIIGPPVAVPGAPVTLTAVPTGTGPFTFRWTQSFGPTGAFSAAQSAVTEFAVNRDAAVGVTVTVTDAGGRTASSTLPIVAGAPFVPPTGAAVGCADVAGLFGRALAAAAANGRLGVSLGVADVDLGGLTVTGLCGSATPRIDVSDASFSVAGVLSGSGITGSLTETELCLTAGTLRLPSDWGVEQITLGTASPLCISTDPTDATPITGSLTLTGLPFLKLPAGVAPPVTTIDFPGTGLHVVSHATIPTGGTVDVDATVDLASPAGSFTAAVTVNDVVVLGQTIDLAGSVVGDAAGIDSFEVIGSVPGPVVLLPGADLTSLNVRWNNTALTASGRLTIGGGAVALDVTGRIVDAQNWELTAAAAVGSAPLTPLPGLTVQPAALTGTVRNVAGVITFDVQAAINGSWDPVPVFHLRQLTAQLSNFAPPSDCPAIPAGAVWFRLAGAATVDVPGQPINVNAAACAGLGSNAWSVGATATLGSWQPVPGIPVSVESLGLHITGIGLTGIVIEATGGLNVSGVHLGALVQIDPISLTIVVDGFGDLSTAGLGLAPGSVGHIVLASAEVPTFRFRDPVLAGVTGVHLGLGMFAGFAPDPGLNSFLVSTLHIPPVTALVLSAQLSGPDITLTAAITLGGSGLTLFSVCPSGGCPTPADATALSLQSLAISISISGSISFAANANLHLPGSPDGATPASDLGLTARLTIDLAGPSITLALFTSDGTWNGALGVAGLNLSQLAIQGGVNFASPVPVPTVGFGATVVNLPATWAAPIGMPTNAAEQEPMSFVLNISQTAPIFALTIGVDDADNHPALRPLQAIGQGNKLEIDFASVVVAPFGGTVGPYTFQPGLSFGFDANINGVAVSVGAHVGLLPPTIDAHVAVGPMSISGVTLNASEVTLHIGTDGFKAHLDTNVALPAGMPTLDVDFDVSVTGVGVRADFVGTLSNWTFGAFGQVDTLTVELHAAMTSLSAPPTAAFSASGAGKVLGTNVNISGGVAFAGPILKSANLKIAAGPFTIGAGAAAVTVTGPGCDLAAGTADDGACLQVAFDKDAVAKFTGSIAGTVTVAGLKATLTGSLDNKGIAASATLDAKEFGSVAVTGRLYSGEPAALAGVTETRPDGTSVAVQKGDFKLTANARTGKLKGFSVSASTMVGKLGGTAFVHLDGSVTVGSTSVIVAADLAFTANAFKFHAQAHLNQLVLGLVTLSNADVVLDDVTGLDATATITVTGLGTVTVAGGFTPASGATPMAWHLDVDADVSLLGTTAAGHLVVDSVEGFTIDVSFNSAVFDFDLHAEVDTTTKRYCMSGDVTITVVGTNPSGHVSFCNKTPTAGFKLSATAFGYTIGPITIPAPQFTFTKSFGASGEDSICGLGGPARVCLGMSGSFDIDVEISSATGVNLGNSNANFSFFADHYDFFGNWVRTKLLSFNATIDEQTGTACSNLSFAGFGGKVCF